MKHLMTTAAILLAMPAVADTLPACERIDRGGYFNLQGDCAERDSRDTDAVRIVVEEEPDPCDGGARCEGPIDPVDPIDPPVDPVDPVDPPADPDPVGEPTDETPADHEPAPPETVDPVW